jgi:hypothetical protein
MQPPFGPKPKVGHVLHTPDPALERAGLLHLEAESHELWEPAPGLGLLVGNTAAASTWLKPWRIEAVLPPRPKVIAKWLMAHNAGPVTVRTRGGALSDVDRVAKQLSGEGDTPWTVFFLRLGRKIVALATQKVAEKPA